MTFRLYRDAFINAAKCAGADVEAYILENHLGPRGELLASDVATLGKKSASKIVVVSSGVHGVELPLGSILQCRWMKDVKELCVADKNVRFVFVHALNPFGAAYGLRNDQENIDINRNFVDFDNKPNTSEPYQFLANAFSPPRLDSFSLMNAWRKMLVFGLITHGRAAFKQALTGGQYDFPDGLYYGGNHPSWSNQTWQSIVKNHIATPSLQNLWHIDIHTGDGARGKMQIHINTHDGSPLHEHVKLFANDKNISLTQQDFAKLSGDILDFWPCLELPSHCMVTPLALEVGTSDALIEGMDIIHTMITRNALRVRLGDQSLAADKIIKRMHQKFAPIGDSEWREESILQGQNFWKRLLTQVSPKIG